MRRWLLWRLCRGRGACSCSSGRRRGRDWEFVSVLGTTVIHGSWWDSSAELGDGLRSMRSSSTRPLLQPEVDVKEMVTYRASKEGRKTPPAWRVRDVVKGVSLGRPVVPLYMGQRLGTRYSREFEQ